MKPTLGRQIIIMLVKGSIAIIGILFAFAVANFITWGMFFSEDYPDNSPTAISQDGACNIAVLPIRGEITVENISADEAETTNLDVVLHYLKKIGYDTGIQGILVFIDSYGGTPAASQIITHELKRFSIPTISLIREYGTSGAYMIATGANAIVASPFSDVGGIGITTSYLDYSEYNQKEGIRYVQLTSGKFKDAFSPDRPMTQEERELAKRDLGIMHNLFVEEVARNRNLPIEAVAKLADGSSVPGQLALDYHLIDVLGDQETARQLFAQALKLSPDEVVFCE